VADIAKQHWRLLGLNNIECRVMEIGNEAMMGEGDERKLDLVFIAANHTYTHTREYFNIGVSMAHDKTIIVIDDIHHSPEMERAWKDICEDERVTSTIDLYQMGLVFFDPHYWHRNYKIRL
jgi:predicted O-methyltransferase YrrM